ncbi:MAG: hypothetical protein OXC30_01180 [Alphaproteobacteria bacterium]|nr:hypothetical protein [Alphaproteobacteria bacterium]
MVRWVTKTGVCYTKQSADAECRYDDCQSIKGVLQDFCQDCTKILDLYKKQKIYIDKLRTYLSACTQNADALLALKRTPVEHLDLYDHCLQ